MRGPVIRSLCQPGSAEAVSWTPLFLFENWRYKQAENIWLRFRDE